MMLEDDDLPTAAVPVWFYAAAIVLCALGMNRVLLLGLTAHMLSQSISKEEWGKLMQGQLP